MFQTILTVTLNPALDTTLIVDRYDTNEPVMAVEEKIFPGGKAINVSRVLTSLGVPNKAFFIGGIETEHRFKELLHQENICFEMILSQGRIRENLSIVLPDQGILQINRKGKGTSLALVEQLKQKINENISRGEETLIVFAGSLPQEVSKADYLAFMKSFHSSHIQLAVDTDLFTEQELCELKPFIIKPNQIELAHIAGRPLETLEDIKAYALYLSETIPHVLISLGKDGLLYAGGGQAFCLSSPQVTVKSTVGAGDTTLAGFISSLVKQYPIADCVRYALACGSASVTLEGTGIVTKVQVDEMLKRIKNC